RARGGFEIDLTWKENELDKVKVFSTLGGVCRIRVKGSLFSLDGKELMAPNNETTDFLFMGPTIKNPLLSDEWEEKENFDLADDYRLYEINTQKGKEYVFKSKK